MTYTLQANEPRLTPSIKNWIQANSKDFTIKEMAEKLGLSRRTIDNHRQNLLVKLGVKNTAGLIKYAYKNNFI